MVNSPKIQEGWDYIIKNQTTNAVSLDGANFVKGVDDAIQQLEKDINSKAGTTMDVGQLKGFIAEYFHADTFNINAALKNSDHRAFVEGSNEHASVDVSTNFGKSYSMKYYATGSESAINQAKNVIQTYQEYLRSSRF